MYNKEGYTNEQLKLENISEFKLDFYNTMLKDGNNYFINKLSDIIRNRFKNRGYEFIKTNYINDKIALEIMFTLTPLSNDIFIDQLYNDMVCETIDDMYNNSMIDYDKAYKYKSYLYMLYNLTKFNNAVTSNIYISFM